MSIEKRLESLEEWAQQIGPPFPHPAELSEEEVELPALDKRMRQEYWDKSRDRYGKFDMAANDYAELLERREQLKASLLLLREYRDSHYMCPLCECKVIEGEDFRCGACKRTDSILAPAPLTEGE